MDRTDRSFIGQAAQSQLAELAFAQLAVQRARNPRVRDYANRLVADQQAFHARLQQIAAAKGLGLPNGLARDQQSDLRRLQATSGDAFDQRFLDRVVRDHQKAMSLLAHEIKGRHQDADLKNFAQDTIIVVQRDFGAAQGLRKDSGHLPGG